MNNSGSVPIVYQVSLIVCAYFFVCSQNCEWFWVCVFCGFKRVRIGGIIKNGNMNLNNKMLPVITNSYFVLFKLQIKYRFFLIVTRPNISRILNKIKCYFLSEFVGTYRIIVVIPEFMDTILRHLLPWCCLSLRVNIDKGYLHKFSCICEYIWFQFTKMHKTIYY